MSEWVAHIQQDWMKAGLNVVWAREYADGRREVTNGTVAWVVTPDTPVTSDVAPLFLREDMVRALHQALLRFYDGADDARMLRKDYDAERVRVDKFIDRLLSVLEAS